MADVFVVGAPHTTASQEIRYCVSPEGIRVAYAIAGEGPPLVKTANWLTHLDLEWHSPVWAHWLHGLAQRFRLIRYDQGLRPLRLGRKRIQLRTWVDDLELVVDSV